MAALGTSSHLNQDLYQGFKNATNNNQTYLALLHAVGILFNQREQIEELRAELDELKSGAPAKEETPAPVRRKTAARKVESEADTDE